MSMKSVNIEDARKILGDLVDRARLADEPVLIMRYNKPAAVLVGADWYGTITGEPVQREGGAS
ncbi:MAG TPA: type II toxin-antitoxin system Phd/YefM family antitoxin [Streptosporangiaceae bacterium]|jgi:prevent-host-death family protein|nr:type II toxin-antitoxin system Phd/YefM family antitoxin [Streptosporangiaceae bacterium]